MKSDNVSARQIPRLLRAEIGRRKLSQYRIAIETGVKQPSLSKFLNGGSLRVETAAILLDYLGFKLVRPGAAVSKSRERRDCGTSKR